MTEPKARRTRAGKKGEPAPIIEAETAQPSNNARITEKERALVEARASGKTIQQAADIAGMPLSTARRALQRDELRAYFVAKLESAGIGLERIIQVIDEGLDAIKYGMTKDGDVVELGKDHQNIVKYADIALRLQDAYPNQRLDIEHKVSGAVILRREDVVGDDPFSPPIDGEFREA